MPYEITQISLDYAIKILSQHCKNKQKFKKNANMIATGGEDHKDYTNKSLKKSRVNGKKFVNSIFKNSAATGSNFYDCIFDNCFFINANFQECSFFKSQIMNNMVDSTVVHSNFNESLFADGFVLQNTCFEHSVFYNAAFINGEIENTSFYSCTLEGVTFSNIEMKNVQFTDLNIDYAVFENIKMQNVVLPFSQICYTFGLLSYLKNTTDNVNVTSDSNKNGYISKEEFLDLLPYFIEYYTETKEYFPLANIYFFVGEYEKAKKAILAGVAEGVAEVDFRRIKYLCKLIAVYGIFNYHERQEINQYICSRISFYNMHSSLLYGYTVYKKEIESYLLNNHRKGIVTAEITITTNIFHDEAEKLGILLTTIEEIIEMYKSPLEEHHIICRHNSAEECILLIQENLPTIIAIVTSLYSVLLACTTLADKILDLRIKQKTLQSLHTKNELEIERSKHELKNIRLDNELKRIELENQRLELLEKKNHPKEEILSRNISQNNVEIIGMSHIIYGNNIPTHMDKLLIQYSYFKS